MQASPIGPSLPLALRVLLSQSTTSLDLTSQTWFLTCWSKSRPDHPGQLQGLVHREPRGLEGVPGQDVPLGQRVEVVLPLDGGELLHPPAFDLAASGVERILGPDGVGVEFLVREESQLPRLLDRPAPLERPVFTEDLERRAERGQIQIDAANPRFLELGRPAGGRLPDRGSTSSQ